MITLNCSPIGLSPKSLIAPKSKTQERPGIAEGPQRDVFFGRRNPSDAEEQIYYIENNYFSRESREWRNALTPFLAVAQSLLEQELPNPEALEAQYFDLYKAFGLVDYGRPIRMVPPLAWKEGKKPSGEPDNTHGALAEIALNIFKKFPPASNMIDAVRQLDASVAVVRKAADDEYEFDRNFFSSERKFSAEPHPKLTKSNNIQSWGIPIHPLMQKLYASAQIKHVVFIASNGAIQIIRRPSAEIMEAIQRNPLAVQESFDVVLEKPGAEPDGRSVWEVFAEENPSFATA